MRIPIVAAALAGLAVAPARAQSLDADFRALCVAHQGEARGVLAAADGAGWQALPAGAKPPALPTGTSLKTFEVRLHPAGASTRMLIVGESEPTPAADGPSSVVKICFLASPQLDAASLAAEKAVLKGDPVAVSAPASIYLVERLSGVSTSLSGPEADAKLKAGGLAIVMLIDSPTVTALGYQSPQPVH